jgi:hypothetical protein
MRFDKVDDLARAPEGMEILIEPNCPSTGVTVAMIIHDGAPIELLSKFPRLQTSTLAVSEQ